ncbi:VaFE repeat-containing surface-anchored protein [Corynebacterium striatum]
MKTFARRSLAASLSAALFLAVAPIATATGAVDKQSTIYGWQDNKPIEHYQIEGRYNPETWWQRVLWVGNELGTDPKELVYCFNEGLPAPVTAKRYEYKHQLGGFKELALKEDESLSEAQLQDKILKVIYNGFNVREDGTSVDRAGIMDRFGLAQDEFDAVTQFAVYYYSDNITNVPAFSQADASRLPYLQDAWRALLGLPLENSSRTGVVNAPELKAYPEGSTLELYNNNGNHVQNLLGAKFVDPQTGEEIPETPAPSTSEQPTTEKITTTTTAATETEVVTTTPKTTVTETAPSTVETVTETTGVTTTTVTVPGEPVTTTETAPGETVTEKTSESDVTTTETIPGNTVTETTSEPTVTTTATAPGKVVTETITESDTTTTETAPGKVVTETVTEPDTTTTATEPGKEVTTTETAPQETVTETTTPAKATVTTTIPVVTEVENAPYIGTKATDKADQDKSFAPEGGVLVDTIEYLGLKPGTEYTVSGELMEKDKDGNAIPTGIKADATFTPETADGSIDVEFTIPEGFEGKTLVVFEELELDGKVVAEHKNIDSVNQTVVVGERTPLIGTIAYEKGSDKTDKIVESGKVIDEVEYTNFIPGEEYTIKGELMDYATGKGTGIVAEKTFVAEEANGTVELEFTIPADFGTKVLVAFETAYNANGEKVAEHVDITDNAQTIATGDKPTTPGDNGSSHGGWLWGLIPIGLLGLVGGSSHGSSNGSSHDGVVESPKHEAPKGESAQEAPKSEESQEAPAKGKRANLANTGADVWMLGLAALLLVAAGGALVLRNRRES